LETGFQTAFAAISQDSGRIIQGLLFGGGYGNYGIVFSRFKQATFNLDPNLWSYTFFRSSSYILELLATTGLLGLLSFFFLVYKIVKERPLFVPLILIIAAAFILPFSFIIQSMFFLLLGLFVATQGLDEHHQHKYFDVELQLVALKKGIISLLPTEEETRAKQDGLSRLLPGFIFAIVAIFVLGIGFISARYILSNIKFQNSLVAAAQNNGSLTYSSEKDAIALFAYSDAYYRIFAQTNLSLANSLASSIKPGSTPSQDTTQTIYTLIQQAINAGRQATTISSQNATDWQNLSGIYRSLIGFGQNADSFAILSAQQAVALDPTNPQEYINLGGIYYQLSQWDNAVQQFQQAVTLKPDFPNAYYNLGHALEQKGDLKGALAQLQTVKTLVANDPTNTAKITGEINALQTQIDNQAKGTNQGQTPATPSSLNAGTPSPTLPPQNPPVKIPGPSVLPIPSQSPTPAPSVSPTPTATP
jgi:tetratricopeptide (TPR) repeat protein